MSSISLGLLVACGPAPSGESGQTKAADANGSKAEDAGSAGTTGGTGESGERSETDKPASDEPFDYKPERFADAQVLRYPVPGFDSLSLRDKKLVYYLYMAALSGHDIIYDQKNANNLAIRKTLEAILRTDVDRSTDEFEKLLTYTKQIWFANGIHHDYSGAKVLPEFSKEYFAERVRELDEKDVPTKVGESVDDYLARITTVMYDPKVEAKRVNRDPKADPARDSANNFYEGVTKKEVEAYYASKEDADPDRPISWGLSSKMVKHGDQVSEAPYFMGGMYGPAIAEIMIWLGKAVQVAENEQQKKVIMKLIDFYETGDLGFFDAYNIEWVKDTDSRVDFVNGFIEVYDDALGYRGSWESVVSIKDMEASKRIKAIADQAQWFEDNSPLLEKHKKKDVVGISAKVITVVVEGGDASPTTPIGINLPNSSWIRKEHGSKSVNLGNIVLAYDEGRGGSGLVKEFAASEEEAARAEKYGSLSSTLKVDMHEVIGHASGQIDPGVGTTKETLKSYASALEEGRADLVALYYLLDPKLVEIGVMPDLEVGKAGYDNYIRSGLMVQLSRLKLGEHLEESHMRNRQMVAAWAYEKGKKDNVIERIEKDGKTYFKINDYEKLRELWGELLQEVQRIKSEGDFKAGKKLIETYGVKVDPKLHKEVLERYAKLDVAPYAGFVQPRLVPVMEGDEIVDVKIEYPESFEAQMLEYADKLSFLPPYN